MEELVYVLLSGTGFCFFLFGLVLLFKPSAFVFRRRVLGAIFIILAWYVCIALLMLSGTVMKYAYMFRAGVPFFYFIPPLIYIYVRSIYKEQKQFQKYDWLHFIPAVLSFIDIFPYLFLTDIAVKRADLIICNANPSMVLVLGRGFIAPIFHYVFRGLMGMVYIMFTWKVIFKGKKNMRTEDKDAKIFTSMFTFLYVGNVLNLKALVINKSWAAFYDLHSFYNLSIFLMLIGLMVMCMFIFTSPTILYEAIAAITRPATAPQLKYHSTKLAEGKPEAPNEASMEEPTLPKSRNEQKQDLSPDFLAEFIPRLEDLMKHSAVFKQQGITINEVALKLNVTPHVLSAVLNNHYNQRFTDFINQYRISYVIELIKSDHTSRQYTIEGLAKTAGFSSRTPFYTAFKKITGMTPSEYLNQLSS
ncbi:helix-turn-helix domain-containing protein [Pedobacter sp. AW31-3R]|uniref:helix-turn-helix domain-containing protein n=1 Tax=Pedobacter sp. AW31-3R TaxID=3445781 RepID=UPI003FA15490